MQVRDRCSVASAWWYIGWVRVLLHGYANVYSKQTSSHALPDQTSWQISVSHNIDLNTYELVC